MVKEPGGAAPRLCHSHRIGSASAPSAAALSTERPPTSTARLDAGLRKPACDPDTATHLTRWERIAGQESPAAVRRVHSLLFKAARPSVIRLLSFDSRSLAVMPHAVPPNVSHDTPELECLDFSGKTTYSDFRDDIVRDGFAVVKNVIPPERAGMYVGELSKVVLGSRRASPDRRPLHRRDPHLARELRTRLQPQRPVHRARRVPAHHYRQGSRPGLRSSSRGV